MLRCCRYRAPEVMLGVPWDSRVDIWSMGCLLSELILGAPIFFAQSVETVLASQVHSPLHRVRYDARGPHTVCLRAHRMPSLQPTMMASVGWQVAILGPMPPHMIKKTPDASRMYFTSTGQVFQVDPPNMPAGCYYLPPQAQARRHMPMPPSRTPLAASRACGAKLHAVAPSVPDSHCPKLKRRSI